MNRRFVLAATAAAALVTALALGDAYAGNYIDNTALVYNVELSLGQSTTFAPSNPPTDGITVDDITYDMDLDLCALQPECVIFTTEDIRGQEPSSFDQPPPLPPPAPPHVYVVTGGPGLTAYEIQRWGRAKGAHFAAELVDSGEHAPPSYNGSLVIDEVSHQAHAELVARETWRWDENGDYQESNGVGTGVGTSLALVGMSQARNFQTPYLMRGDTITFQTVTGATAYGGGTVKMKGRAYFPGMATPAGGNP